MVQVGDSKTKDRTADKSSALDPDVDRGISGKGSLYAAHFYFSISGKRKDP